MAQLMRRDTEHRIEMIWEDAFGELAMRLGLTDDETDELTATAEEMGPIPYPFPPTGPGQPRTRAELSAAMGGDIRAMEDPYVKLLMRELPDE